MQRLSSLDENNATSSRSTSFSMAFVSTFVVSIACAAQQVPSPTGLLVDFKASPSMGVTASPAFTWVVPHLPRSSACALRGVNNQLQHSFQIQVGLAGTSTVLHDSGRLTSAQSANVGYISTAVNQPANQLAAGTTYSWRVRAWTSADQASVIG
jgi:hypothetical protein